MVLQTILSTKIESEISHKTLKTRVPECQSTDHNHTIRGIASRSSDCQSCQLSASFCVARCLKMVSQRSSSCLSRSAAFGSSSPSWPGSGLCSPAASCFRRAACTTYRCGGSRWRCESLPLNSHWLWLEWYWVDWTALGILCRGLCRGHVNMCTSDAASAIAEEPAGRHRRSNAHPSWQHLEVTSVAGLAMAPRRRLASSETPGMRTCTASVSAMRSTCSELRCEHESRDSQNKRMRPT